MKKYLSLFLGFVLFFVATTVARAAKPTSIGSNGVELSWQNTSCTTIQDGTLLASDGSLLTTGFDQWGYNYQAHMFNGGYCDSYRDAAWCQPYKDVQLLMKWNDAWLANTDCEDADLLLDRHYGFISYRGSGAWLTNHQSGSYEGDNWILDGSWELGFNSTKWPSGNPYMHTMTVVGNTATGASSGNTWLATISISGDTVTIVADYQPGSAVYPYTFTAIGTLSLSGTLSGTWTDTLGDTGTWNSTSGGAIKEVINWNYFVKIVAAPTDAVLGSGVWETAGGDVIGPQIWGDFAIIQEISNDPGTGDHGLIYKGEAPSGFGFYKP